MLNLITLVATYLVGTTQYRRFASEEDCREVITSASNALRFLARFRSPLICLRASCKRQRLVLIACRLADKDLNQRSKKQHKKGSILTLSEAARIIYSKFFILGALIFQAKSHFCNSCELGIFSNRSELIRAKPSKCARVNEVLVITNLTYFNRVESTPSDGKLVPPFLRTTCLVQDFWYLFP